MIKTKNCDPKTLALIAARFMTAGDDETEALRKAGMLQEESLRKANALYNAACEYAKRFASLSADDQAIELDPEKMREFETGEELAIGDSEANSPALEYFRKIAKTKIDKNIMHKKFLNIIKRFFDCRPEVEKTKPWTPPKKIDPGVIDDLPAWLRVERSLARSARREKSGK
jgi:hypothetical protein